MTEKTEEQENIADLESEKKIERQKRRKARKMKQEDLFGK